MERSVSITSSTLYTIGGLARSLYSRANCLLKKDGFMIRADQVPVLVIVYYRGVLCQQEIANILGRDKSSIQRSVVALVREGYLKVEADNNDRRRNLITLTTAGFSITEKLNKELIVLDGVLFSSLQNSDKEVLNNIAGKIEYAIQHS